MTGRQTILSLGDMDRHVEGELGRDFTLLSTQAARLEDLLAAHGQAITGLVARGRTPIGPALLAALPNLQIIANYGVGYDAIDCAAAAARGVIVTNTPDVLNDEMADFTVGLLLATIRQIPQADAFLRAGNWAKGSFPLTASLRGRSIGIAGMGRIGTVLAQRLAAFDRPIAYYGRTPRPALPYPHYLTLESLAEAVDTLIVVLPGGAATHHAVNAAVLARLGPQGVLINVARGSVVDEPALVTALQSGTIAAAGLDVFAHEPLAQSPLLALPNVVLTPHMGTGTHHTRRLMGDLVIENIRAWYAGRGPLTPVAETPWPAAANIA